MRHLWFVVMLILVCCTSFSSPVFAKWYPPASSVTVRPGHSIWMVSIGMSRQNVRKALGPPSQIYNFKGRKSDLWFEGGTGDATWNDLSYIIVDYSSEKVVQIVANLPEAATQANFSTHSTLSQIRIEFKNIKQVASFADVDMKAIVFSDKRQGIGFSFVSDSNHVAPSSEPTCFIVFKSGRRISPSWF